MSEREIVIFNRDIPAGVSTILRNIIANKPASDVQYKLILYYFKGNERLRIGEDWCEQVIRTELTDEDNLYYSLKKLKSLINDRSIIVANDVMELRLAALLKLKNPLVYVVHGDFETYYKQCDMFQDYMDVIICYSRHILEKLNQRLKKENREKVRLLYYPVQAIFPGKKISGSLRIVFVGSLIYRKGVDLLPGIVADLDRRNIDYRLEIIGSGEMEAAIQESFKDKARVVFRGQLSNDQVIKTFQQSHILLFPTRSEGLPNVLVEAMKAGCVPVVSDIPSGIPDIVINNKNGLLIKPDNHLGFTDAIAMLAGDRSKLSDLSSSAIASANKMFDAQENAKNYFEAFLSALEKTQVPAGAVHTGRILNKAWLPNFLVKGVRKLKISPKL